MYSTLPACKVRKARTSTVRPLASTIRVPVRYEYEIPPAMLVRHRTVPYRSSSDLQYSYPLSP